MATRAEAEGLGGPVARALGLAAAVVLGLLLLGGAVLIGLNTAPGRAFVADQLAGFRSQAGIGLRIGRIEGSIYGRMTLRDLEIVDSRGVVATAPIATFSWQPGRLLRREGVWIDELEAPTARMLRNPVFLPTDPNAPLLPDIDIHVGRFSVGALTLEPPVAGRREVLRTAGTIDIRSGRALVRNETTTTAGDRLVLDLDALPDGDRFDLEASLRAPAGGVVAGLLGVKQPIDLGVGGAGRWTAWEGRAQGSFGGRPLVDLRVTANAGRFRLTGTAQPAGLVPPAAARLLAPAVSLDATADMAERAVRLNATATSDALRVAANGTVDLGRGLFRGLRVDAELLRPAAALDQLSGRDVRLALTIDGALRAPAVSYAASATRIGFGTTSFEAVRLDGQTVVPREGPIPLPFRLSAARVLGFQAAVGDLVRNFTARGLLRVTPTGLTGDDIAFRSDRLDGRATLAATFATGQYVAAVEGRIQRYAVPGLGLVDLAANARIVPDRAGNLGLRATIDARGVRIDNEGLRSALGGAPVARAVVERRGDGTFVLTSGTLTAPKLRVTRASGTYAASGRISLSAAGTSGDYGPFSVDATGTLEQPRATVRLARPGLGAGLRDVVATITPAAGGYLVVAQGQSAQGPFAARATLQVGGGRPIVADIAELRLAGLVARGRVSQTAAGPFAGRLTVDGSGLNAIVNLAADGRVQLADGRFTARNARLPLDPPVLIASGAGAFSARLVPNAPTIRGSARLQGLRREGLALQTVDAAVDYRAGRGTAGIRLASVDQVPLDARIGVAFEPGRYRATLTGTLNRLPIRLAAPAEIVAERDGYRLLPATLLLPNDGRLDVQGTTAGGAALDARLANVDLGLARALGPGFELGGRANGTVSLRDLSGETLPTGTANLAVTRLVRETVAGRSLPVDVALLATSTPAGAEASAVVRRQNVVIGRAQGRLVPGAGDTLAARMQAGAISAGLRFNGPAEALWALAGIAGQDLRGPLAIGADVTGTLASPIINGVARGRALRYENLAFGTVIDQIVLDARFAGRQVRLVTLTGRAGSGTVSATGNATLDASAGTPFDFQGQLRAAQLASSDGLNAVVSGPLRLTGGGGKATFSGDLTIDRARYRIQRAETEQVVTIPVRRKGATPPPPPEPSAFPTAIALDLRVRTGRPVQVEGLGLDSEWNADVRVRGTADAPRLVGQAIAERGTFDFAGRTLELDRGRVSFTGAGPLDSTLDILATTTVQDVTATVTITGTALKPQIVFGSTPDLPQDEILSRLLFGASVTDLSPTEALQLAAALNGLRGGGGFDPIGSLRRATGLDRLRIIGADQTTGRGTALAFGKYIGRRLYVEVTTDAEGNAATQLQFTLSRVFSVLATLGSFGSNSINARYSRDY